MHHIFIRKKKAKLDGKDEFACIKRLQMTNVFSSIDVLANHFMQYRWL